MLELLNLQYTSFSYVGVETRLIYSILSSALKVHSINKFMEQRVGMLAQSGAAAREGEEPKAAEHEEKDAEKAPRKSPAAADYSDAQALSAKPMVAQALSFSDDDEHEEDDEEKAPEHEDEEGFDLDESEEE